MDESGFVERLVAAIQLSADPAASVNWDERIGGRQFDVVVRFESGFSRFLVAIECKHEARPVEVSELDAFVTKGHDARADKLQFFSTSGFQTGAKSVAERHGIDIFEIHFPADVPEFVKIFDPQAEVSSTTDYLSIPALRFCYSDGQITLIKYPAAELEYYLRKTRVQNSERETTLDELLSELIATKEIQSKKFSFQFPLAPPIRLIPPDNFRLKAGEISEIKLDGSVEQSFVIKSKIVMDPNSIPRDVEIKNALTGERKKFSEFKLPFGLSNKFQVGSFYYSPTNQFYYFCEALTEDQATLILVESFQHGELVRATITCSREEQTHQIEVVDQSTIERLRSRLDEYRRPSKKPSVAEAERLRRYRVLGWPPIRS